MRICVRVVQNGNQISLKRDRLKIHLDDVKVTSVESGRVLKISSHSFKPCLRMFLIKRSLAFKNSTLHSFVNFSLVYFQ